MNGSGPTGVTYDYDASGSFLSKSDYASQHNYHASRPHVITSVTLIGGGTVNFSHDQNGNP